MTNYWKNAMKLGKSWKQSEMLKCCFICILNLKQKYSIFSAENSKIKLVTDWTNNKFRVVLRTKFLKVLGAVSKDLRK